MTSPNHGKQREQWSADDRSASAALQQAAGKIAPLWPLEDFVAVNPFLGMTHLPVEEAASTVARAGGARVTLTRADYARALHKGEITPADLDAALDEARRRGAPTGGASSAAAVQALLGTGTDWDPTSHAVKTLVDVTDEVMQTRWSPFVVDRLSRWAAGHFDQGQASWRSPWRDLSPFPAWKAESALDRGPEVAGIPRARATIAALPDDAAEAASEALGRLGVEPEGWELYLHRLARSASGWIAHARYLDWQAELRGESTSNAMEVLAIRLAWELVLHEAFRCDELDASWKSARASYAAGPGDELRTAIAFDLLLMRAHELAHRRRLFHPLGKGAKKTRLRPSVQAAFCIDVRSERMRRNLEAVDEGAETLGFAGFFGAPVALVPPRGGRAVPQCPALLAPQLVASPEGMSEVAGLWHPDDVTEAKTVAERAWRSFKLGAVACFGFVETAGPAYLLKLVKDGLGRPHAEADRERPGALRLQKLADEEHAEPTEISLAERVELAEGILRGMSLTNHFARLVALVGHGASTTNNPYAASYECGACGGHPGGANARIVAALMNAPDVRAGLATRGITIPEDTHFLAGQHDTTLDEITFFDVAAVPGSHRSEFEQLQSNVERAGEATRSMRADALGLADEGDLLQTLKKRGDDWAQVRPEWGLAGCTAFVAAPRDRTAGLDLAGQVFLHDYEWRQDEGFGTLESILTAPAVVASWISLQYSASTADNRAFGSGNKLLHNVVGRVGVLEGNGGDLRVGLPWQSVHDGEDFVHAPTRLSVLVDAPLEAITDIIAQNPGLAELVDNGWVQLLAMNAQGAVGHVYVGGGRWEDAEPGPEVLAA